MENNKRALEIIRRLRKQFPDAKCALNYHNPLQLLVSTILSAQCTDVRVNIVTKDLFKKYKTAKDFANVKQSELENDIKSTGFYRNKAKNIIMCCKSIVQEHKGKVPDTMEELVKLRGVGRKTANVVLGNAFKKNEGIVVDTHVSRISQRLELTEHKNPEKIEKDLMHLVPKNDWTDFSHLLISHGRKTCVARKPKCEECILLQICPYGKKYVKSFKKK